jgi:hypothetical protein
MPMHNFAKQAGKLGLKFSVSKGLFESGGLIRRSDESLFRGCKPGVRRPQVPYGRLIETTISINNDSGIPLSFPRFLNLSVILPVQTYSLERK